MKREAFKWRDWGTYENVVNDSYGSAGRTCGSDALAMVANQSPWVLEQKYLPRNQRHFGVSTMIRALEAEGWETKHFPHPEAVVNQTYHPDDWAADYVRPSHLFFAVCHSTKTGASWFVFHHGKVWHNGSLFSESPFFCLTNPMIECILIRKKQQ